MSSPSWGLDKQQREGTYLSGSHYRHVGIGGEEMSTKKSWMVPLGLSCLLDAHLHPQCLSLGGQTLGLRGGLCEGQGIAGPRLGRGEFGSFLAQVGGFCGAAGMASSHMNAELYSQGHTPSHMDKQLDTQKSMNRSRP